MKGPTHLHCLLTMDIDSHLLMLFVNLQVIGSYLCVVRHLAAKCVCRLAVCLDVKLLDTIRFQRLNDYAIGQIGAFLDRCSSESNEVFQNAE